MHGGGEGGSWSGELLHGIDLDEMLKRTREVWQSCQVLIVLYKSGSGDICPSLDSLAVKGLGHEVKGCWFVSLS